MTRRPKPTKAKWDDDDGYLPRPASRVAVFGNPQTIMPVYHDAVWFQFGRNEILDLATTTAAELAQWNGYNGA